MSTEHHDQGGHELEAINTKLLFRLMISLSIVTLLASMAVVQWYYSQRSELVQRHAVEGSYLLAEYKEQMTKDLEGIDAARKQLLANMGLLLPPPPPPGWVHPDDLLLGGAPAVAPPPTEPVAPVVVTPDPSIVVTPTDAPVPVEGQPAPADEKPADEKPADEKPADEKPAKPANDKPAKPADDKPAKPAEPAPGNE